VRAARRDQPARADVRTGAVVSGTFRVRKSAVNKRELDVEIHYAVRGPEDGAGAGKAREAETVVQMYKVR
jgi:protein arginine N-methyltransferase 3